MPRKPGLTLQRHRELARLLFDMRNEMGRLMVELSPLYSVNDRAQKELARTQHHLDALRSVLDGHLAREFPDDFDPSIYYPAAKQRS